LYSDLLNQIIILIRFFLSFFILYILWPRVIFRTDEGGGLDAFMARFAKMVMLTIAIGYVLVLIKLYELLSVFFVLAALSLASSVAGYNRARFGQSLDDLWTNIISWFYDFLDGLAHPLAVLAEWWRKKDAWLKKSFYRHMVGLNAIGNSLSFTAVFIYSGFLRFYDALVHAAPAMSDAYVTLAWMKYIGERSLFHDGIYPQGFHIVLSVLQKFTVYDSLYVLKYTGPLAGVLTALGIYMLVSRLTGRNLPGVVSAFIFGVLGSFLPIEWSRQASTNSQEFALIFLMPAFYFSIKYLWNRKRGDLWTAGAMYGTMGLVHVIPFAFACVGLLFLFIAHLLIDFKRYFRQAWYLCLAMAAAGAISVLPALVGLALGNSFHSASAGFIVNQIAVQQPEITVIDELAVAGLVLFFIVSIFKKKTKYDLIVPVFFMIFGLAAYIMYLTLGPVTGRAVLVSRMGLLWGVMAPVGIGVGWHALSQMIPGQRKKQTVVLLMGIATMAGAVAYIRPAPIEPYKMQHDSMVEQYLRINNEFTPTAWTMVSQEEGYDLALGRGWHIMLGDFLKWYNPEERRLIKRVDGSAEVLSAEDIFIFYEKNMFRPEPPEMEHILARREAEYRELRQWLDKYQAAHDNMSLYFEDENIQVYHIHQPKTREEIFREIWGDGDGNAGH